MKLQSNSRTKKQKPDRLNKVSGPMGSPNMLHCQCLIRPYNTRRSFPPIFSRRLDAGELNSSMAAANSVRVAAAQMTSVNDIAANFATCSRLVKVISNLYSFFVFSHEFSLQKHFRRRLNLKIWINFTRFLTKILF